jgi:hypothetical protein
MLPPHQRSFRSSPIAPPDIPPARDCPKCGGPRRNQWRATGSGKYSWVGVCFPCRERYDRERSLQLKAEREQGIVRPKRKRRSPAERARQAPPYLSR